MIQIFFFNLNHGLSYIWQKVVQCSNMMSQFHVLKEKPNFSMFPLFSRGVRSFLLVMDVALISYKCWNFWPK
jgi:hypothetical protein